jgi:hypothetical protein
MYSVDRLLSYGQVHWMFVHRCSIFKCAILSGLLWRRNGVSIDDITWSTKTFIVIYIWCVLQEPAKIENNKYFCCCCCKSGPLTLVTQLPASGYVPGQIIPMIIEVDNASKNPISRVVCELIQVGIISINVGCLGVYLSCWFEFISCSVNCFDRLV